MKRTKSLKLSMLLKLIKTNSGSYYKKPKLEFLAKPQQLKVRMGKLPLKLPISLESGG